MTGALLVLNGGSSSLKFAVYPLEQGQAAFLRGSVSSLGHKPQLRIVRQGEVIREVEVSKHPISPIEATRVVMEAIADTASQRAIEAVGHRIVHGGEWFTAPIVLDDDALSRLRRLVPLAPLHQPHNLDLVEFAAERLPGAVQIGCFDTAFHAGRPRLDHLYGLPRRMIDEGLVAYGFHGLSYAHIAEVLRQRYGERAGGRTIVAHLGSGASMCAMIEGRSVATTMGFSALDGLVMSTRCGALDPGIILHLLTERGVDAAHLTHLLYQEAGLLGLSGISGSMSELLASEDPRAAEAVDLFVYRAVRTIGSLAAALGGLDTLVFTAGIGENAPEIRARIAAGSRWLGVALDAERNAANEDDITDPAGSVRALVIPADEESAIAAGAISVIKGT